MSAPALVSLAVSLPGAEPLGQKQPGHREHDRERQRDEPGHLGGEHR